MGFTCYIAKCNCYERLRKYYIKHLRQHMLVGEIQTLIYCKQNNCERFYDDITKLNAHLRLDHDDLDEELRLIDKSQQDSLLHVDENILINNQLNYHGLNQQFYSRCIESNILCNKECNTHNEGLETFKLKLMSFIAKMTLISSLCEQTILFILNCMSDLSAHSIDIFENIVLSTDQNHVETSSIIKFKNDIYEAFTSVNSKYKQHKLVEKTGFYIESESIYLGKRIDTRVVNGSVKHVQKNVAFEYISIRKTLSILLKIQFYKNIIEKDLVDLKRFKPHLKTNKWIYITLYYDELECKNPLGDVSGVYKLGMFYFTISNLPRKYNSSLQNIFLVGIIFVEDVKLYGLDKVLNQIVYDIKLLETEGFFVNQVKYNATLLQFVADNLSHHQVFGLKCNFTGEDICHLCNASSDNIQSKFVESQFEIMNKNILNSKIQFWCNQKIPHYKHCVLNETIYFHTTDNYAFDLTHDLWEGIVPVLIDLLLEEYIKEKKYFSLEFLNHRISSFKFGLSDVKNKPNLIRINTNSQSKNAFNLKQKAAKCMCLFRVLPFVIGEKIDENNKCWAIYKKLSLIIDLLYVEFPSSVVPAQLEWLIQEYQFLYKDLFKRNLTKKHHNMVHYPNAIRKYGSLVAFTTLRYEAKHSYFKKLVQASNNCINIPKMLARKHQVALSYNLMSYDSSYKPINATSSSINKSDVSLNLKLLINSCDKLKVKDQFNISSSVEYFGQNYRVNMILICGKDDTFPLFGQITNVLTVDDDVFFVVNVMKTICFDDHYHAYEVEFLTIEKIIHIDELLHYHPIDVYTPISTIKENKKQFVRPYVSIE